MGDYPWSVSLDGARREPRSSLSASLDSGVVRRTRRTRRSGDGRGTGRGRIPPRVARAAAGPAAGRADRADGHRERGRADGLSLDDFPVGFTVRLRLLLVEGHPIVEEQRRQDAEFHHRRAEAARRGALEADDAEEEATFVGRFLPVPEEERAAFLAGFPPVPEWELEARDDRGRQYRNWGGESSWGSSLEGRAEPIFTPALDPAARELRLVVPEVQWRTVAGREMGEIVAVDRGPWAFTVAL
jgi:hypothetical protein